MSGHDELMMYLAREYICDTRIYGIEKSEFSKHLKSFRKGHLRDQTLSPLCKLSGPYSLVKIEIVTSGGLASHHLFIAKHSTIDCTFSLGRSISCDIVVNQSTISREQCRFYCNNKTPERGYWSIRDGTSLRESSNGTWLCLTDYRLRPFKQESVP